MVRMKQTLGSGICAIAFLVVVSTIANAEDGYRLWLRYDRLPASAIATYRSKISSLIVDGKSPALEVVSDELINGLAGLLGKSISRTKKIDRDGAVLVLTPDSGL